MTDNIIRFPIRSIAGVHFNQDEHDALTAMIDRRAEQWSVRPDEVWLEETRGNPGRYLVTLVSQLYSPVPGLEGSVWPTYEPVAGYADWHVAIAAATVIAEHLDVKLIDLTGPETAA